MSLLPFKVLNDTIQQQESLFEQLVRSGRNLLDTSEPGPDRDGFENKLSDATQRWESVKQQTLERQEQLDRVLPLAKEFHSDIQGVKPWLLDAEKRLRGVDCDLTDQFSIDQQLVALNELEQEIAERRPIVDTLNETCLSLTNNCSTDKFVIEGETQDAKKRFDDLNGEVSVIKNKLAKLKQVLEHYNKALMPLEDLLESTEKSLASCEPTGINVAKCKEQIKTVEDLLSSLIAHETDVDEVLNAGGKLASTLDPKSAEVPRVKQEVDTLSKRYQDLLESLNQEKQQLERGTEKALGFQDALRTLEEWLPRVEEAVAAQEPISSDSEVVKEQLQHAEVSGLNLASLPLGFTVV